MNAVDCSPETIEREWRRIEVEHKVEAVIIPDEQSEIAEPIVNSQGQEVTPEQLQSEKEDILKKWVSAGLAGLFNSLLDLRVERCIFDEFSLLTAQMLIKHNPDSSVLEIITKYELEIKWFWATGMMLKALAAGFSEKKARKLEEQAANTEQTTDTKAITDDADNQ